MRIRTFKPEFWHDEKIGALHPFARLLFLATWSAADDEGLVRWSPEHLKSIAFAYDDDISVEDVSGLMDQLQQLGLVFVYRAGVARQLIGYIVRFRRHQRINRPTPGRLTPPPLGDPAVVRMYAERDGWLCHLCGEEIPREPLEGVVDGVPLEHLNLVVDRIVPRSSKGSDYPTNVAVAHAACSLARRGRAVEEFRQPASVATAVARLAYGVSESVSDSLSGSVSDSVSGSVSDSRSDSLSEVQQSVTTPQNRFTERDNSSVSDSVSDSRSDSLRERKGREGKGVCVSVPKEASVARGASSDNTHIPSDWLPTDRHRQLATQRGLDADREARRFRAYAKAKGRVIADPDAAFELWLLDTQPRRPLRAVPDPAPSSLPEVGPDTPDEQVQLTREQIDDLLGLEEPPPPPAEVAAGGLDAIREWWAEESGRWHADRHARAVAVLRKRAAARVVAT
jgi:hypothetical protein